MKKKMMMILSRLVLWLGFVFVGILAVPTGMLVILISLVGTCTDQAVSWFSRKK
ncbi:MAG: hypothetical protein HFH24_11325 [Ruminococcus sp.]|nr:hypothetical protein [Ruminococcus sp.]